MKVAMLALAAITAASGAMAQECREIDNDLDRLGCYDLEAGRTPVAESVETEIDSPWDVRVTTSDMTDDTTVVLSVSSDETLTCGYSPSRASLILRCNENTTVMYISTSCHVASGHGGYGRVTYRFDDALAQTKEFSASTNNNALGLWSGGKSIPVIQQMFGHDTALFRFTPFSESPTTARFDISGLEDEIGPLREACHW